MKTQENHLNMAASAMQPEMLSFVNRERLGGTVKLARRETLGHVKSSLGSTVGGISHLNGDETVEYPETSQADKQWQVQLFKSQLGCECFS